jgi:hypothetical protein
MASGEGQEGACRNDAAAGDVSLYGEHQVDAASMVGHYMDALIQSTGSRGASTGLAGTDGAADTDGGIVTAGGASKAKATSVEKADTFNNFVRKNLKSGGSSKKLNRSTSRVSMAKQRWINRSGEQGGQKGGKYGSKYGRQGGFKYSGGGGGGGGGGEGRDGESGGGNSYSKPRGLQQWGLDSLEMSLDLIAAIPPAAEPSQTGSQADLQVEAQLPDAEEDNGEDELEVEGVDSQVSGVRQAPSRQAAKSQEVPSSAAQASRTRPTAPFVPSAPTTAPARAAPSSVSRTNTSASAKPRGKPSAQDKIAAKIAARQKENERVQAMTALAPKCPGHSMVAKLLVVKKSGANKVRYTTSDVWPSAWQTDVLAGSWRVQIVCYF